MVLEPGDAEGHSGNRHDGADQWLFVVSGTGVAKVNGRRVPLRAGSLLLIEHGDRHEIRNNGRGRLTTLNFYVPPAYSPKGDELAAGKPAEKAKPRRLWAKSSRIVARTILTALRRILPTLDRANPRLERRAHSMKMRTTTAPGGRHAQCSRRRRRSLDTRAARKTARAARILDTHRRVPGRSARQSRALPPTSACSTCGCPTAKVSSSCTKGWPSAPTSS